MKSLSLAILAIVVVTSFVRSQPTTTWPPFRQAELEEYGPKILPIIGKLLDLNDQLLKEKPNKYKCVAMASAIRKDFAKLPLTERVYSSQGSSEREILCVKRLQGLGKKVMEIGDLELKAPGTFKSELARLQLD